MKHRFRRKLLYILLLVVDKIILSFPVDFAIAIGRYFGILAYFILPKFSKIAKENLKNAFPDKTPAEINRITMGVFRNLGMNAAEVLSISKIKKQALRRIYSTGFDKIDKALEKGKGAIILSAHFGNWELLPVYFVAKGYPSNVVARHIYYEKYDEWVSLLRKTTGVNIIFRDESPRKIVEALKSNELLGIMPDQDIDSIEGVFVKFFKRPAYTPTAPVALSAKIGSPILPCFIIRERNRHKIIIEDPVNLKSTGNEERDITENTQAWSDVIESYIKKYPEHWVWMHKRWKTRPRS
ncbi:MAG: lysophospholipid acyltransferase family protein [Candidatus Omnitrophica bacterium]|nr:lysophospholipid acyltransferase family protein [Candidatus Omnitrophota bacterium]